MTVRLPFGKILLFLCLVFTRPAASAQVKDSILIDSISVICTEGSVIKDSVQAPDDLPVVKPKRRLVAALLCLALGPFGMHRLYLGTKPHVAAAYTLTLGGGIGLVPLIDFFFIVFDPNLYKYKDNNKFIMWLK
jgi:TM2 domain-containing membrane protein YozV